MKLKNDKNLKNKTNLILFVLFCTLTLSLSVGYSALNEELNISGDASFRVKEDIRITNVNLLETTNLGIENYTSKFGKNSITLGVSLPNIDSSVTYKVEIINSGTVSMWIDSITEGLNNNANMEYSLEGLGIRELINPGEVKEFNLKIMYKEGITLPGDKTLDTMIRFNFMKPVSTLAKGTSGNGETTFFNNGPIKKASVETITFLPTLEVGEEAIGYWDASENQNGTVIAWYTDKDNNGLYELNVGGIGEVYASDNSTYLFNNFNKLLSINFENYFNTRSVTNMHNMFNGCSSLQSLDLSSFDTSNVTSMSNMFNGCSSLQLLNLSNFNTANVIYMASIFKNCSSLKLLDVSIFNTSNVTSMSEMFYGCKSLSSIDVSTLDLNKVTTIADMFYGCSKIETLDLSKWHTPNLKYIQSGDWDYGLFAGCSNLKEIDLSGLDTTNVVSFQAMFNNCYSLSSLDLSMLNTSNVTNMILTFANCKTLKSLDLSSWDTSNVVKFGRVFGGTFYNCQSLTNLEIGNWDVSKATNFDFMFSGCKNLSYIPIENWNTASLKDLSGTFYDSGVISLDLSSWNTDNLTTVTYNVYGAFSDCTKLESINVSGWNTSKITNVYQLFRNCTSLKSLDLSTWDLSNATIVSSRIIDFDIKIEDLNISSLSLEQIIAILSSEFVNKNMNVIVKDESIKNALMENFNTYNIIVMGS